MRVGLSGLFVYSRLQTGISIQRQSLDRDVVRL